MIRTAKKHDAAAIAEIYNHYVDKTIITFAETHISTHEIQKQIAEGFPWYVWEENTMIYGYAHASQFKSRCAYKTSVESTIYLHPNYTKKGIGSKLYKVLIDDLKKLGYHTIIGGISLPNPISISLHEKFGYQKIAHFKEVGNKFGEYIDVGYWQLLFKEKP